MSEEPDVGASRETWARRIEDELRARVGELRFGFDRHEIDYAAWVEEVLDSLEMRFGGLERGVGRAEDWIRHGYPVPPAWFRSARGVPE